MIITQLTSNWNNSNKIMLDYLIANEITSFEEYQEVFSADHYYNLPDFVRNCPPFLETRFSDIYGMSGEANFKRRIAQFEVYLKDMFLSLLWNYSDSVLSDYSINEIKEKRKEILMDLNSIIKSVHEYKYLSFLPKGEHSLLIQNELSQKEKMELYQLCKEEQYSKILFNRSLEVQFFTDGIYHLA